MSTSFEKFQVQTNNFKRFLTQTAYTTVGYQVT